MRTRSTVLNAITSVVSMLISSALSLVAVRTVLVHLGSDYNGLNSTITQFVSMLMLVESGFTLAALVRLYAPYGKNDYAEVNRILSKTKLILRRIGWTMLILGLVGSCLYALIIDTNIEYFTRVLLFSFSIAATVFNFAFVYKYRLVFQVTQREYIIHTINMLQYILMYGGMILAIITTKSIVVARLVVLLANIIGGMLIAAVAKKTFPFISFCEECSTVHIDGTKDLLISKLVGVLYNSLTIFYMSVFVGMIQTSVYTVYNSVVALMSNFINTALLAPQNSLGQIINTEKEKARQVVHEYEYTAVLIATILFSTTTALIIPFIRVYTVGVNDTNYIQPLVGLLLIAIAVLQIIHIPSGRCIELSGDFKAVRNIQLITFCFLAGMSLVGALVAGLIGLLFAKLLTNLALATMEIIYAHKKILNVRITRYMNILLPNIFFASIISWLEFWILKDTVLNWFLFVICGFSLLLINTITMISVGLIFYRKDLQTIWHRYCGVIYHIMRNV